MSVKNSLLASNIKEIVFISNVVYHYWTNDCEIDNYRLPNDIFGISCNMMCGPGFYMILNDEGSTTCTKCPDNFYNIGEKINLLSNSVRTSLYKMEYTQNCLVNYELNELNCTKWDLSGDEIRLKLENTTAQNNQTNNLYFGFDYLDDGMVIKG